MPFKIGALYDDCANVAGCAPAGWKPALAAAEIHLWLADLDRPPRPWAELAATLAASRAGMPVVNLTADEMAREFSWDD